MRLTNRRPIVTLAVAASMILGTLTVNPAKADDPPATLPAIWLLTNYSGHPVWGKFELQSKDSVSIAEIPVTDPLLANERKMPPPGNGNILLHEFYELYMMGGFCYLGSWWSLKRSAQLSVPWGHIRGDVPIEVGLVSGPGMLWLHLSEIGSPVTRVNLDRTDAVPGDKCVMQQ